MKYLYYSIFFSLAASTLSINAINDFVTRYGTYGHIVTMPQYFMLHDYSSDTCQQATDQQPTHQGTMTDRQCQNDTQNGHSIKRICARCHTK